jgi:cytochrome c5
MWMRIDGLDPSFSIPAPTGPERVAMVQYMVANALQVSAAALPEGPGRDLFSTTCSRCHELADPRQHSPDDWVAVVRRMMDHMQEMLGESLSQEQLGTISNYLRLASGG